MVVTSLSGTKVNCGLQTCTVDSMLSDSGVFLLSFLFFLFVPFCATDPTILSGTFLVVKAPDWYDLPELLPFFRANRSF